MFVNYEITTTEIFEKWHKNLKDRQAFKAVSNRLIRATVGNLGDVVSVGSNVSEMRIFVGKGYRLYFTIRKQHTIIMLNGGDKSTQKRDIKKAKDILAKL